MASKETPNPIRRRRRRLLIGAALVLLLAMPVFLTRSPLVKAVLLPGIGSTIGADIDASRVVIEPDARIVATDVRVRVPGVAGEAGEIFAADRVELQSGWGRILRGSAVLDRVRLTRPRLRVSRGRDDGIFNLSRLALEDSDDGPPDAVPLIEVDGGVIELGEHLGDEYTVLRRLDVQGAVRPTVDPGQLGYEIAFAEDAVSGEDGEGLRLRGRLSPSGATLTLEGVLLSDWGPENVPAQYRDVFGLMQITGAIPHTAMGIGADGSLAFRAELEGVSLNLPFDAEGNQPATAEDMVRLQEVSGTIEVDDDGARATLAGVLGDLPSLVRLDYDGLTRDAAFRCEITTEGFELSANPELLPLAPGIVVRRLTDFSNPTATVNASILVARGEPVGGEPAPIEVEGELAFTNGSAAFRKFPYRFENLRGLAVFDEEKIEIVEITGEAPSGATIRVTGVISPPAPGAAVKLLVETRGVPVDGTLRAALGDRRRSIVEAMFDEAKHARLTEMGLVRTPGSPGAGREFALGGVADVDIEILRRQGAHTGYTKQVRVMLAEAGLVPDPFPLPILARDVVLEIGEDDARIVGGTFRGLSGGEASITTSVDLSGEEGIGLTMDIVASGVPADDLLLAALPGGLDETPGPDEPSEVLRRLGVRGEIDCVARIRPGETEDVDYEIDVTFDDLEARPTHFESSGAIPLRMVGASGKAHITRPTLDLAFTGALASAAEDGEPRGTLEVRTTLGLEGEASRPVEVELEARVDDVAVAVEDLLAVVSPESAQRIVDLRERYRPAGALGVRVSARGDLAGEDRMDRVDIVVTEADAFGFDLGEQRVVVDASAGEAEISAVDPRAFRFRGFEAVLGAPGERTVDVVASGDLPLGGAWRAGDELELSLRGASSTSSIVRRVVSGFLPETLWDRAERIQLSGEADAELLVRGVGPEGTRPMVTGTIEPRSVAAVLGGQAVRVPSFAGGIELDETGGSFEGCRLEADGWAADVGGTWVATGNGRTLFDCSFDAGSDVGLRADVVAMLPLGIRGVLDALSVRTDERIEARDVALRFSTDPTGVTGYRSSGRVNFTGVTGELGVKIAEASGYLDFVTESSDPDGLPNFGVGIIAERAVAAGVQLSECAVRLASHPQTRTVLVPVIVANAHGGRLSGSASVDVSGDGPGKFESEMRLSNVPLGELLADWELALGIERASAGEQEMPEREAAQRRGFVDGSLSLSGTLGGVAVERRGRGAIHVGGGPVLRLPLLLPLIQVSNLQIPAGAELDFAETVFFLEGDRVVFERMSVFTESVEIFGFGQMHLPDNALDLRFNSRALRRVPLVSEIVERFRDELISTRVRGTLGEPEVSVEQFARTRRLLGAAVGSEMTPDQRRMAEIERLSRESVRRERRSDRPSGASRGRGG